MSLRNSCRIDSRARALTRSPVHELRTSATIVPAMGGGPRPQYLTSTCQMAARAKDTLGLPKPKPEGDSASAARSPQPAARSPKPAARNRSPKPQPETAARNRSPKPQPEHRSPQPAARSPKPEARSPKPEARNRSPKPNRSGRRGRCHASRRSALPKSALDDQRALKSEASRGRGQALEAGQAPVLFDNARFPDRVGRSSRRLPYR